MNFWLGCNYWASNAGTDMWIKFDPNAIREDLEILTANGVEYLRVFPNWRDFQPVKILRNWASTFEEYVMNDESEPTNPYYIDQLMIERFRIFCDICKEYNVKLIVGILTGWMSGAIFVPPALNGRNLFLDHVAQLFEQRFVKGFVEAVKDIENIVAWDLGNECNCMSKIEDTGEYTACDVSTSWVYMISNAIRSADNTRPVLSGMASLSADRNKTAWNLQEHGECIDVLTTHPYTYFHPNCGNSFFTSIRSTMHATAQTRYFADISGKPCFVEEIGTLGNSLCSDSVAGDFMKVNLYSNWANDNMGLLWWCANEQNELTNAPYSWGMLEVELGMIDRNRKPKTYLTEMGKFSQFLKSLDFELPKPKYDAVCIVPRGYMTWDTFGIAFASYILSKQAHINIKFCFSDDDLPDADTYILPSLKQYKTLKFYKLKEKVENGATLYISSNGAFIQDLSGFAGIEICDSAGSRKNIDFEFGGKKLSVTTDRIYKTKAISAEVLSTDSENNPVITRNKYGKGTVCYVNVPLEFSKMTEFDAYSDGAYKIYEELLGAAKKGNVVSIENPNLCITHHFDSDVCYCVIINHSDKIQSIDMKISKEYVLEKVYKGNIYDIEPFEACVLKLKKI